MCPACKGPLTCDAMSASAPEDEELPDGSLGCGACGLSFPVVRGIPRLSRAKESIGVAQHRTASAFGWQWLRFSRLHDGWEDYEERFLDWINPLRGDDLAGKVVLDAGCGMGEFTAVAARLGARRVIGVDLSESVEAAHEFTRGLPNAAIVQADLYSLPLAAPFALVFSVGVIHHLPDPEGGVRALAGHLAPGGTLYVWVYGFENNWWVRRLVSPLRVRVTARLPKLALYVLSLLLAAFLHPILTLAYKERPGRPRWLRRALPYADYLTWLARYGFRHTHCVIFDHLNAPTAVYVKRGELRSWIERAGLGEIILSWRNRNSWRAFGQRIA